MKQEISKEEEQQRQENMNVAVHKKFARPRIRPKSETASLTNFQH
jgi:hypothetical protein